MDSAIIAPEPWMVLPFGLLLAAIALGPVLSPQRWARHYPKVAYALGAVTLGYYLFGLHAYQRVLLVGHEYLSFMALIGSLFVVSGGIHISVSGGATPRLNTVFLLVGAVIANLLGTTGASMLLIRPWIRMNQHRISAHHIVFFIFIISNIGGCLTPVGDPPLFLGYLKGIPFWWVAEHCWPMWVVAVGLLLAIFYLIDALNYRRSSSEIRSLLAGPHAPWRFEDGWNVIYLLVILGAVFINRPAFLREALMTAAGAGSYLTTRKAVHEANHFNFHPLQEVAILFAGIFATMMPALDWLQDNAGRLANPGPGLFYWGAGLLSSVLDNAPTYLTFLSAELGMAQTKMGTTDLGTAFLVGNSPFNECVVAISVGAVFFGACTYIGNGPNFMVKAIADQHKVRMPGFLGFVLRYTLPCLLPVLILVWLLFFW